MPRLALLAVPAAAALAVAGLSTAAAAPSKARTFSVLESNLQLSAIDLPPTQGTESDPPSRGDMVVFTKRLSTPSGKRAGLMHVVCTVTVPRPSLETSLFQCDGTYALRGGTLAISHGGPISARTLRLAVTGGTGAYAGARGTIVSQAGSGDEARDTVRLR